MVYWEATSSPASNCMSNLAIWGQLDLPLICASSITLFIVAPGSNFTLIGLNSPKRVKKEKEIYGWRVQCTFDAVKSEIWGNLLGATFLDDPYLYCDLFIYPSLTNWHALNGPQGWIAFEKYPGCLQEKHSLYLAFGNLCKANLTSSLKSLARLPSPQLNY